MNIRQKRLLLAVFLLDAVGCAGVNAPASSAEEDQQSPAQIFSTDKTAMVATICQIRENPAKYVGKKVVLSATYLTDSSFYSYLIDKKCNGRQILDLESNEVSADKSVDDFDKFVEKECAVECAFESDVLVEGTVVENSKGRPSLRKSNVIGYEKKRK